MRVERIQKVLAARGLGSRREIEEWIRRGEVKVNGRVATLGDGCEPGDRIDVRGRTVHDTGIRHRWIAYHKPEGEICTRKDEQGRPTIFHHLPRVRGGRWVSVGRLDLNTSGLLLLTTDGDLAHGLMHPTSGIERAYAVRVLGEMPENALDLLMQGVELEDGPARALTAVEAGGQGANRWIHVTVAEGRNRLVRRLFMALGATVSRLIRVRYGAIELGSGLRSGTHRELEADEVRWLYAAAGLRCPLDEQRTAGPRKGRGRSKAESEARDPSRDQTRSRARSQSASERQPERRGPRASDPKSIGPEPGQRGRRGEGSSRGSQHRVSARPFGSSSGSSLSPRSDATSTSRASREASSAEQDAAEGASRSATGATHPDASGGRTVRRPRAGASGLSLVAALLPG